MKRGRKTPVKVDVRKTNPELYRASRTASPLRVGRATFLAVDGAGEPGCPAFQDAIRSVFALAYAAKFALKASGQIDFAVPALECLWFDSPADAPRDRWRWRLMVRIPDQVSARDLQPVRKGLADRKQVDTSGVKRITWTEGPALQMLHLGPYEGLGAAYEQLAASGSELGLSCVGPAHEIYLSDPRRAAPDKLKTLVRMGARRASTA